MFTAEHHAATTEQPSQADLPSETHLAISTVCMAGALEDKLRAAATAGFHAVEILEYDLVMSPLSPRQIRDETANLGLSVAAYQPVHVEAVESTAFEERLRRAEHKFSVMEDLGCDTLLVCSSKSSDGFDDDDLAADQLHALADRATEHGIRIAYEAVPWGRVTTHDHAWRIIQRAGHRNLGLCLDSFHVLSEGTSASSGHIPGSKVFYVQLADAPRSDMDIREWSLHHRMFPGQGSLDLIGFVRPLLATGYTGPLTAEVFNDVYQQADPQHAATDAMRSMLALTETIGIRDSVTAGTSQTSGAILPTAPRLEGFAFAELAVDDVSGPLLTRTLTALGFVHTGQHRSKPVQLWQQGRARILLNYAPQRAMAPSTAAFCALAVESTAPGVSARRAEQLLAPALPRPRQPDEADLTSVAAPDGTAVFFCNTADEGSWADDFTPTGVEMPGAILLTEVDHISFTEAVDDFDQAALFYRTVLGLRPDAITEFTAPFGLTRSWTATDTDRNVRVSLNTAPLRHGDWAPAIPNPQHIAFATDDVIAAAEAMADVGAPLLTIPGNYYDDLETRVEFPPDLAAAIREHSILYDRDEHGEYLHFFTEILGSRVFFEVVQRVDGYTGVGAPPSATVRMAAHRRQRLSTLAGHTSIPENTLRHDYSLAHLTALSLSPPELVDTAGATGYRYVGLRLTKVTPEEPHYPLASDPALLRATKTHLAASGVEVLDVELARIAPNDDPREFVRFLETGAELGARHVITQLPDPDFSRKVDHFAELCALAQPFDLTVDLEFPSWTETRDLAETTRVLRSAAQPNAGILIDLLHFARSASSVDELRQLPVEWFHFAHVCDAPAKIPSTTEGLIHTARFERMVPGEGGIDMHEILSALPPGIPYALEIPRATLVAQVGAKEHARMAISAARQHLDDDQATHHRTTSTRAQPA